MKIRLLEYESKNIFADFNIPLVPNVVIEKEDDIERKISGFRFPAIVKSQIAIGSRKKAGLIKTANSKEEALRYCEDFFNRKIAGYEVKAILIEELVEIKHEYYVSVALDVSERKFYLIASRKGGVDIEEVSKKSPEDIFKISFSYLQGLTDDTAQEMAKNLGFTDKLQESAVGIFKKLWEVTKDLDL